MIQRDPKFNNPQQKQMLMNRLINKHRLTTQWIDEKQYRQIMKRLAKYIEADAE